MLYQNCFSQMFAQLIVLKFFQLYNFRMDLKYQILGMANDVSQKNIKNITWRLVGEGGIPRPLRRTLRGSVMDFTISFVFWMSAFNM